VARNNAPATASTVKIFFGHRRFLTLTFLPSRKEPPEGAESAENRWDNSAASATSAVSCPSFVTCHCLEPIPVKTAREMARETAREIRGRCERGIELMRLLRVYTYRSVSRY
jgi:hypothetical protein